MNYYAISIKTQFDNLGDALINRQLILEASAHGKVLVDLSRCPKSFICMLDIDRHSNIKIFKSSSNFILQVIKFKIRGNKVFYFLNPGGLGGVNPLRKKFLAILYNFFLFFLMLLSIRIVHAGFSLSKQTVLDMKISSLRSKLCYKVNPRDTASYSYMKENGFKVQPVIPDFAFLLTLSGHAYKKDNAIIFSFRCDSEYRESMSFIQSTIMAVFNAHPSFHFRFVSQVRRDNDYTNELYEWFCRNFSRDCSIHFLYSNIDDNLNLYSSSFAAYSNRLHVLMLCWSVGCTPHPCLAKGTGNKIKALFTDLNLERYIVTKSENVFSVPSEFGSDLVEAFWIQSNRAKNFFSKELI